LCYDRGIYDFNHKFDLFPRYYRYPVAAYRNWLSVDHARGDMAESMFFCSKRILSICDFSVHVTSNYVDAYALPFVPPYELLTVRGETVPVSCDVKYVYDVMVSCTYLSKRWIMEEIAKSSSRKVIPICRSINYDRDGHLVLPDGANFVPIVKTGVVGLCRYYSKFEKFDDDDSPSGHFFTYDPSSRVHVRTCRKLDGDVVKIVSSKPSRAVRGVPRSTRMVHLPLVSWSRMCDGPGGGLLSVITEYSRYLKYDESQLNRVYPGDVDYYDVFNCIVDGAYQSTIGCSSLKRSTESGRELIGVTLIEWLNESIYGVGGKKTKKFVFSQVRFDQIKLNGGQDRDVGKNCVGRPVPRSIKVEEQLD